MLQKASISAFLEMIPGIPILDVRSPAEFEHGHIRSAVSFPLFSNEERSIIGTLYKKKGRQVAVKKGLEVVGPKMKYFIEEAERFNSEDLGVYCWRGGMRSESMSWLLQQYGFQTIVLNGGYKAYRRKIESFFNQDFSLKIITGYTGSRKTEILQNIREKGGQVVDLEALANHQGSSFGNQKSCSQPSTEQFQNSIFEAFRVLDLAQPIFLEDECMRIGRVNLIESLFKQMSKSPHLLIEVEKSERIKFLVEEYGMLTKDQLISATSAIRKKLGHDMAKKAIELIDEGDLVAASQIILTYYDKRYQMSIARKKRLVRSRYNTSLKDLKEVAAEIVNDALQAY